MNYKAYFLVIINLVFVCFNSFAQKPRIIPPVFLNRDGKLVYIVDEKGDRIPDYSYAGYKAAEEQIPDIPIKIVVPVQKGDATYVIQAAIDYVSNLEPDKNGFRGTILLEKGIYEISGSINLSVSGVVLRGSGMGNKGTILLAKGQGRETLIKINGENDKILGRPVIIDQAYVPVNSMKIKIPQNSNFKIGDKIIIQRCSNQKWIDELGMNYFGGATDWLKWKPNERNVFWDRTIITLENESLILDVPITCAIDTTWGGGTIIPYTWKGRISNIGIENLKCISEYDTTNLKDENHRWCAITVDNSQDIWIRQITLEHFAGSAVMINPSTKRVTVQDCKSLNPVSEIGGYRRYTFFTEGQQVLFQRCYSEYGYHDFAVGFCAAGPNAFVQCQSYLSNGFSGAIDSWACGVLFDIVNIDGDMLRLSNRESDYSGAGYCAANSMIWQSSAAKVECYKPPYAQNWAFGVWSQFSGNGFWYDNNRNINPRSFYYAQLKDRIGEKALNKAFIYPVLRNAQGNPTIELAKELAEEAKKPPVTVETWIDKVVEMDKIPVEYSKKTITTDDITIQVPENKSNINDVKIVNGWVTFQDEIITGQRLNTDWWKGDPRVYEAPNAKPHVTRYVTGKTGTGYTDDLNEVIDIMDQQNWRVMDHHYGLWYERRRDDHEQIRRIDGEVWAPFYELPFARSGIGTAWDGLSKYDLTKYNYWYWKRLNDFADLADNKGIVLLHQNYFQHNILEAGAHYADFPWRTANNINNTPFPEPVPYADNQRIYMAEQFYDVSNPEYRELHRKYIRKCLDNFETNNVIQLISDEYTGPLHFVEFWIDVIMEWEKETGKSTTIGLSTTKDVQDAILADPARSKVIDLIDIRYWSYRDDSSLYAQPSGNLAPRQYSRIPGIKSGSRSFDQVYRSVREYKDKYPDKAVIYSEGRYDVYSWAVFMAGGSLAPIPKVENEKFLSNAASMHPGNLEGQPWMHYVLKNDKEEYIVYNDTDEPVRVVLAEALKNGYNIYWIDSENGKILKTLTNEMVGEGIELKKQSDKPEIIWVCEGE